MFNPLDHKGIPLDQQLRNWRELNVEPIDPEAVDPYTRCRIITMNGIEVESILFQHQFARNCPDDEVRRQLAYTRYVENQQQRLVNWLLPGLASVLETTLGYEQVAVGWTGIPASTCTTPRPTPAGPPGRTLVRLPRRPDDPPRRTQNRPRARD
jgi:hypothetical protein